MSTAAARVLRPPAGPGGRPAVVRGAVRRAARAGVAAAGVALLAACSAGPSLPTVPSFEGGASPTASATPTPPTTGEVLAQARVFALSAQGGHVAGTVQRGRVRVTIDLEGDAAGTQQRLRVAAPGAGTAELLTVGDRTWLSGDRAFWAHRLGSAAAARPYAGRFLVVSPAEAAAVGPFTLRGLLSARFARADVVALERDATPVTPEPVDGADGADGWRLGAAGATGLVVAADGSAALARFTTVGADPSDLTFDGWGSAPSFTEPAPADVITP